jgi:hypothetical protein
MENSSVRSRVIFGLKIAPVLLIILFLSLFSTGCGQDDQLTFHYLVLLDGKPWTGDIYCYTDQFITVSGDVNGKWVEKQATVALFSIYDIKETAVSPTAEHDGPFNTFYVSGGPEGATYDGMVVFTLQNSMEAYYTDGSLYYQTTAKTHNVTVNTEPGDGVWRDYFYTFMFTTKGKADVKATLNGKPWEGPVSYQIDYVKPAETRGSYEHRENFVYYYLNQQKIGPVSGDSVAKSFDLKTGYYTVSYISGGPEGATLNRITPGAGIEVKPGQPASSVFNFVKTDANTLKVEATLDGQPWEGPLEFVVNPPENDGNGLKPIPGDTAPTNDGSRQVRPDEIGKKGQNFNGATVPAVFKNVENGIYNISYISGGPTNARFENASPDNLSLENDQEGTLTLAFTTKGIVNINVLVDGEPYTRPAGFTLFGKRDTLNPNVIWYNFSESITSLPYSRELEPANYVVSYPRNLPDGAVFVSSTPDEEFFGAGFFGLYISGKLNPGGELTFTLNYTKKGSVIVNGTKDGAAWSGPCEFTLTAMDIMSVNPDTGAQTRVVLRGHQLPAVYTGVMPGQYMLTYVSGGPDNLIPVIKPSSLQNVKIGIETGYTLEFGSGSLTVTGSIRGAAWSGACNYIIDGPVTRTGTEVPFTFTGLPMGTYTITYLSGAPDKCDFSDIFVPGNLLPQDTLELTPESKTGRFNIRFIEIPVVIVASADLRVTGVGTFIGVGPKGTYAVTVTNLGPDAAAGVVVNIALPPNEDGAGTNWAVTWASDTGAGAYNPGTGDWNVGTLASGASVTITITVDISPVPAMTINNYFTATATITASGVADNNPANNTVNISYHS